jgi:flagella basal body P-ring formation protein FlgA
MAAEADLCFERLMEMLTADTLISAMRITPGFEQAQIDIVEFSRFAVPRGHLEFPREGLVGGSEPAAGALWRGFVRYGENRKFAIWARARISVSFRRVVAAANLSAGNPITPEQVRVEEYTALVPRQGQAQSVEQVAGRVPRRPVAAGSAICLYQLDEAKDIRRGDMVEIDVRSGTTRLSFVGRAETAGRVGENISIRNLSSGRTFRARVEGKGAAVVTTGASR